MTLPKIIALGGPTASGKSTLGRTLAAHFNGEIINVDSRQIYTDLTIGTAK
ncbi:MAG: (d)CMP kinase, partial [Candidatus Dojkabacteria bacterium]|nr:(d)CMP kinase [Candidatus Dojkabacteria bacterium]